MSLATRQIRFRRHVAVPRRRAPFDMEPGFWEPGGLWLYGNFNLLFGDLASISCACVRGYFLSFELRQIEQEAERLVLGGKVLVCGIHHEAHKRIAIVPLRYGAPRVLVLPGGFHYHLGKALQDEPFGAARLWRYQWDPKTDLAVSRRAPEKLPTYAYHNPSVDRVIARLAAKEWPGQREERELISSVLVKPQS